MTSDMSAPDTFSGTLHFDHVVDEPDRLALEVFALATLERATVRVALEPPRALRVSGTPDDVVTVCEAFQKRTWRAS